MDVLAGFLAECCELDTGHWQYAKDLYECYKRWCDENGERPEPQRKFGGRLGERHGMFRRSTQLPPLPP
jgi:putative DNA primase/helicase